MNAQWDIPLHVETSLAAFVCNALPNQTNDSSSGGSTNKSEGAGSQTSTDMKLLENRSLAVEIGIPSSSNSVGHAPMSNVNMFMYSFFFTETSAHCNHMHQIGVGFCIVFGQNDSDF
jgi:hypothetical protein